MMPRHRRLLFLLLAVLGLSLAAGLSLLALSENVTYYLTASDVLEKQQRLLKEGKPFRLGGMVEKGSVQKNGTDLLFAVTDMKHSLTVHFQGMPPDLFREGQGVVAEGKLTEKGTFEASQLLAKHDENYMPPQLVSPADEK